MRCTNSYPEQRCLKQVCSVLSVRHVAQTPSDQAPERLRVAVCSADKFPREAGLLRRRRAMALSDNILFEPAERGMGGSTVGERANQVDPLRGPEFGRGRRMEFAMPQEPHATYLERSITQRYGSDRAVLDNPGRHETEEQREDRNLIELLQELRVGALGVQVLFGFLLSLPFFAVRFDGLSHLQRMLYMANLLLAAARDRTAVRPGCLSSVGVPPPLEASTLALGQCDGHSWASSCSSRRLRVGVASSKLCRAGAVGPTDRLFDASHFRGPVVRSAFGRKESVESLIGGKAAHSTGSLDPERSRCPSSERLRASMRWLCDRRCAAPPVPDERVAEQTDSHLARLGTIAKPYLANSAGSSPGLRDPAPFCDRSARSRGQGRYGASAEVGCDGMSPSVRPPLLAPALMLGLGQILDLLVAEHRTAPPPSRPRPEPNSPPCPGAR